MRDTPNMDDKAIQPRTYQRLLLCLESVYPGKWRRSVDVCPVAVNKTIDNEIDARETIERIEQARPPKCECGKPATCIGAYEGLRPERYSCDDCCGHGNEDGHCEMLQAFKIRMR